MAQTDHARIVIPAGRPTDPLCACIESIVASELNLSTEIVIVDDGGAQSLDTLSLPLAVNIRSANNCGSAAQARNLGAEEFDGEFLVFIDADVEIEPSCLDELLRPIATGIAEATVGNYSTEVDGLNFPSAYKQLYISHIYGRHHEMLKNDFWTAISAVRAPLFFALGGFDTRFKGACGEDAEFGIRLTQAGHRILAVDAARGRHLKQHSLRSLVINDWQKGRVAMQNFYRSQGQLGDNRHASRRDTLAAALGLLLLVLSPLTLWSGLPLIAAALLLVCVAGAYLFTRLDLVQTFGRRGAGFLVRAVPLMLLLDNVRSLCVASGVLEHHLGRLRDVSPPVSQTASTH